MLNRPGSRITKKRAIGETRVFVHDHSGIDSGGKLNVSSAIVGGLGTITGSIPPIEGSDHGALSGLAEDDHTQYVLTTDGGRDNQQDHGTSGSTETVDPTNGNVHYVELDDDCAITIGAPATARSGRVSMIEVYVEGDGTSVPTFAASGGTIVWPGGSMPAFDVTDGAVTRYLFETLDDGNVWYGSQVGGGSDFDLADTVTAETAYDIASNAGASTEASRGDHTHGTPALPAGVGWILVDAGTPSVDAGPPFEVTVETLFGIDGSDVPYYNAGGATTGDEATLYWDPTDQVYHLVPFNFP